MCADGDELMSRSRCGSRRASSVAILSVECQGQAAYGGGWASASGSESKSRSRTRAMTLPILFRGEIAQGVSRALLIEKVNIFIDLLSNWLLAGHMQVHEQFGFDPAIDGLHCGIVSRCSGAGHRTCESIHGQQFVERLGGIDGTLIGVKNRLVIRILLFEFNQVIQPTDVGHAVTPLGGEGMADDLIVPQVHIQRQFMVDAFHIESGHVAYDALQWFVYLHLSHEQIGENSRWITCFLVLIVLGFALDPSSLTTLMGIRIRENKPFVQPNLGVQPAIAVRWIL